MNSSTSKTTFEIVNEMKPRGLYDLRDVVVDEEKRSVEGEEFTDYMCSLHKDVKLNLEKSNLNYSKNVDKSRRNHEFKVGD